MRIEQIDRFRCGCSARLAVSEHEAVLQVERVTPCVEHSFLTDRLSRRALWDWLRDHVSR